MGPVRRVAFVAGPLLAAAVWIAITSLTNLGAPAAWTAAITTGCAVWWIFEPVPLPATSLIPFAALPLTGVLGHREVATAYGHHLVLLMLAGSIVASAMERSGAHRRVAIGMVRVIGGEGSRRLVLAFLVVSAGLSMWMSNTATTVMLLPVALAIVTASDAEDLGPPLLLAVAYGASIGGSATPVGTPPNLVFLGQVRAQTGSEPSFLEWMSWGVPVAVVMVPLAWLWLARGLEGTARVKLPVLGAWRPEERRVLLVFAATALAWVTRSEPGGGWASALGVEGYAGDSTVAIAAAVVLFVLPRGGGQEGRLLDWDTAVKIPWGVFIMIGGGIALGMAFKASHLDAELGASLAFVTTWPLWLLLPGVCLVMTFATEVTSNTAAANVALPILAAVATAGGMDPMLLMLPAVLGLNHAFMLPVATASNAIVYGTDRIPTARMAREGLVLNLVGVAVIATICGLRLG